MEEKILKIKQTALSEIEKATDKNFLIFYPSDAHMPEPMSFDFPTFKSFIISSVS